MIWKRYFYKEIFKTFAFLLFGFYALYIAIDLMTHLKDLRQGHTSFSTWVLYYLCTFSRRLDVLIPFTVLIGTIRLLIMLQTRNELVALLTSGVPMRTLVSPFLVAALSASLLLYINFEWALPAAQPRAILIQENDFGKGKAKEEEPAIHEVLLKDSSRLFYKSYHPVIRQFQDVFWIASIDRIYHMSTLTNENGKIIGRMVDILARDDAGNLEKMASHAELLLPEMQLDDEVLQSSNTQPRDQSISLLYSEMRLYGESVSDRAIDIRSNYYYKLTFPLICLLAMMAPASYCLAFRRYTAHFMIYMLALGGLFCFFLLVQVALVLAKSQIVSPAIAIGVPWLIASFAIGKDYMRVINGAL